MELQKQNRLNRMVIILGFMAFLANGDNYAASTLLIDISKDFNLSYGTAALSVTAYMFAFGAFTLIFGPLSDRFGKVKVINIAAFGTSIFSILGGFAYDLPSLVFCRAVNGAFGAGIFPVMMAIVGQSFDDQHRHQALAKVLGLGFLGAAMATAIGGVLAYFGSWRLVYIFYGIGELALSVVMFKTLDRDHPIVEKLNFIKAYQAPLSNFKFMRIALTLLFVGFSVFGSFSYSGKLVQEITGYSILPVGLILSLYGFGTVIGGRTASKFKMKVGTTRYFIITGCIGFLSTFILFYSKEVLWVALGLFFFGVSFVFLQSTLVAAAQDQLPQARGTAMSLTSFNMFVGGAIGTRVNANIIATYGTPWIYLIAAVLLLAVGLVSTIFARNTAGQAVLQDSKG
ncbi:MAG TPA: MFS transporter [Alphaproteobacteria bacterium]|nr:MFS transporter [Alphaproteobacteria bacterium]